MQYKTNYFFQNREIKRKYNIKKNKKIVFFQYHPETLEENYGFDGMRNTLEILSELKQYQIISLSVTLIISLKNLIHILEITKKNNNFYLFESINYKDYLTILKNSEFIIGNSSSAIIEAPTLKTPSINIGQRQHGRLRSNSVFDCNYSKKDILKKLIKHLILIEKILKL